MKFQQTRGFGALLIIRRLRLLLELETYLFYRFNIDSPMFVTARASGYPNRLGSEHLK